MNKKATAIVGYIGILGFLIAYLAGDKEGAKFDLNQGLILALIEICCSIIVYIPFIGFLGGIIDLVAIIFAIIGIVNAAKDVEQPLPLIGGITLLK